MSSRKHKARDAHSLDHFLRSSLKNWVAKYPPPDGGRRRLLQTAYSTPSASNSNLRWFWRAMINRLDGVLGTNRLPISLSIDISVHSRALSIHHYPLWMMCAK
jgi:hypothetical protein